MTELTADFAPDWVSPPGETILDMAEERGWAQTELAQRLGFTEKHTSQLINGKVPLSLDAAQRLERVVGGTVEFWLTREANYQNHKARIDAAEKHASWIPWLDELPVKELMNAGAISKQRLVAKNKVNIVKACLRFFSVASPTQWRTYYGGMEVAFRRSQAEQSDVGAIAAWLRLGEQKAEQLYVPKYNKARFEKALKEIRTLTCEPAEVFEPKIRSMLAEAGVKFVLVPAIPKSRVSGVARWLSPTQPLIQLSLYGKSNDKFWFTFFHEAAHILLHSSNAEEKKSVFLDDPNATHTDDPQEHEANQWAGNWLIPEQYSNRLSALKTKASITVFAEELGIHPGIVVGRLQHDGYIPYAAMNDFKQKLDFVRADDD